MFFTFTPRYGVDWQRHPKRVKEHLPDYIRLFRKGTPGCQGIPIPPRPKSTASSSSLNTSSVPLMAMREPPGDAAPPPASAFFAADGRPLRLPSKEGGMRPMTAPGSSSATEPRLAEVSPAEEGPETSVWNPAVTTYYVGPSSRSEPDVFLEYGGETTLHPLDEIVAVKRYNQVKAYLPEVVPRLKERKFLPGFLELNDKARAAELEALRKHRERQKVFEEKRRKNLEGTKNPNLFQTFLTQAKHKEFFRGKEEMERWLKDCTILLRVLFPRSIV